MKDKKIVTGIGELLWDKLPEGKKIGGAPCNFAFHAVQAGCNSFIISAIGNDELGKEIVEVVKSQSLNDEFIQTNSYPTGTVTVELDQQGHPNYIIHENVAWDFINWESKLLQLAEKTDAVCFGSLAQRNAQSENSIYKFLNSVSNNCLKVFDINLRQEFYSSKIIENSLNQANILKLNDDELIIVASLFSITGNTEKQLLTLMERFDLDYIAYTMGSKGSILLNQNEFSFFEAPKVNVVDTVGAGDAFTAILVAGILNNIPLKEIHKKATNVAAFVCTCEGAMSTKAKDKALYEFDK